MRSFPLLLLALPMTAMSLETVTVTADRVDTNDATHSISVIDNIEQEQPMHIYELMTQSPGTWISKNNGQEHLTAIRSPVLTGAGGCGPFLMSEDNVSLRAPAFCNVNQLFDTNFEQAGRIEVLRGPGSAFHGSNAMHGIINIISPSFSEKTTTRLTGEYENTHDYGRFLVDHRTPSTVAQAHFTDDNGYKESSGFTQQKVRLKQKQLINDWTWEHNLNVSNLEQETAGYISGTDAYRDKDLRDANSDPDAFRDAWSFRYHGNISYSPDDDSLFILTPYLRSNEMEFMMHWLPGTPIEENGHDSIGVQSAFFRPFSDTTELATGFDFDYSYGHLKQEQENTISATFPEGEHYNYNVAVITTAMFLQSTTALHKDVDMTLGVRYEYARYRYNNKRDNNSTCATNPNCRFFAPEDTSEDFYNWSPKFAVDWQWAKHQQLFVNLSQGYRSPQTSELFRLENGQSVADIDSEEILSAELGFTGLIGAMASYQLSFYRMQKDNVIFKDSNRQNVDDQETRHKGVELSLSIDLSESVNFSGQFTYAKHQYASEADLLFTSGDIENNIIDTAPRHMHNVTMTVKPTDTSNVAVEWVYMGSYYLDPQNNFSYPGHILVNLKYHQQLPAQWDLGIAVHNLADIAYADRADALFGNERYFIGEPRSLRLSVSKTF